MSKAPLIFSVKGNSLDDGPGIRSVVFFKGCPLSCVWCHNPESKSPNPELSFDPSKCIGCNACIETCTEKALSRDNPFFIDRRRCTLCFECADGCPAEALCRVGREWTVEQLVAKIGKDKPFFKTSGGGATLSGGEPTLHLEFLSQLLAALKQKGIHTLIETCGLFDGDEFIRAALPHTDAIYMDLKLFDGTEHQRHCGVDNRRILENFTRLHILSRAGGFEILPRVPLIPGITDGKKNLAAIGKFLQEQGAGRVLLLPNNPTWHDKCPTIGAASPFANDSPTRKWLPSERLEECQKIFAGSSIEVV